VKGMLIIFKMIYFKIDACNNTLLPVT